MTKKEFKQALLRGQGRCIQAVKVNKEKYRDLVMWACEHNLSYDTQCEGTRVWFVYQMVCLYSDRTPFIEVTINKMKKYHPVYGWELSHLSALLSFFVADGSELAKKVLEDKYKEFYDTLMKRKGLPNRYFHERDDFEQLCILLASDETSFLRIVGDIGRLYRCKNFIDGDDFAYFEYLNEKRYSNILKKMAETSEDIASYIEEKQKYDSANKQKNESEITSIKGRSGVPLSIWLKRNNSEAIISRCVQEYLNENDLGVRAEKLLAFSNCPYPADPTPVMEDTSSDCEELRDAAWRALGEVQHPLVREFVLSKVDTDVEVSDVVSVLAKNYQSEDAELLERLVKSVPVDYKDTTYWHETQLSVLEMGDDRLKVSPSLLYYIYETTYCSCCRERVLKQMGRRRLLTDDMLEECLYDSNEDIRKYALKSLRRRKRLNN